MSRELKIGIIVASSLFLLYWGGSYLGGTNVLKKQQDYYAVYADVNGLTVSNQVRYKGYKVGRVNEITFLPEKDRWLVGFSVTDGNLNLTDSAIAKISSADLLGTMNIELLHVAGGIRVLEIGDTLASEVAKDLGAQVDEQVKPLVMKVQGLIGEVDSVLAVVTKILDENTIGSLQGAVNKLPAAFNNLLLITQKADSIMQDLNDAKIGQVVENLNVITGNLAKNSDNLTGIFENVEALTDSLAKSNVRSTMLHLNKVLSQVDSIATDVQQGKGTLGQFLKDDKLYNDLALAVMDLDLLLMDLRENPGRYVQVSVFGKKAKKAETPNRDKSIYSEDRFPNVTRDSANFVSDSVLLGELVKKLVKQELIKKDSVQTK